MLCLEQPGLEFLWPSNGTKLPSLAARHFVVCVSLGTLLGDVGVHTIVGVQVEARIPSLE